MTVRSQVKGQDIIAKVMVEGTSLVSKRRTSNRVSVYQYFLDISIAVS